MGRLSRLGRLAPILVLLITAPGVGCGGGGDADPDAGADGDTDTDADGDTDGDTDTETESESETCAESELPSGITAIAGTDAQLPTDDLQPLVQILGEATLVGLGESGHTSEGYYAAKARLFRFLVEEMGFRALAIESPWDAARAVGEHVADGTGNATAAITSGLFGVWASQSMLELVEWMRAWNVAHPDDPVAFFGFDIQQPEVDAPAVEAFVEEWLPDQAVALLAGIATCAGTGPSTCDEGDFTACLAGVDAVRAAIEEREAEIVAASSQEVYELGLIHVVGMRAWEGQLYYVSCGDALSMYLGFEARDEGMAYVLLALVELYHPEQKVAVWAHNGHLMMRFDEWAGFLMMGVLLREQLGDAYAPIGLVGYSVSLNWPGVYVGEYPPPTGDDTIEVMLHHLCREALLVDLAFPDAAAPFFTPGETYGITETLAGTYPGVPADQFRALVFLDESPPMDALSW